MCKKPIITLTNGIVSTKDVETTDNPINEENSFKDNQKDCEKDFEDEEFEIE